MPINRGPWNTLVDDDGSNLVGTVWNKDKIKTTILDPADAAIALLSPLCVGPNLVAPALTVAETHNYRPPNGENTVIWELSGTAATVALSGILAEPAGTMHYLFCTGGKNIVLQHLSANSAAANRIIGPGYGNYTLALWTITPIVYVSTYSAWIVIKPS